MDLREAGEDDSRMADIKGLPHPLSFGDISTAHVSALSMDADWSAWSLLGHALEHMDPDCSCGMHEG